MPITPKMDKKIDATATKTCVRCGRLLPRQQFAQTRSVFFDGNISLCHDCVNIYLEKNEYKWDKIDKLCQWADIPWIVKEWERLSETNSKEVVWSVYSNIFGDDCYENLGWEDYDKQYRTLRETGYLHEELPLINEQKMNELKRTWGGNYEDSELYYLEDLYKGLLTSQNVNGALQIDQARKICKLSLEIDSRIRAGDKEVDKFLASYDKLVKTAEFTPKNTKNAIDFDSFAEVGRWLEKRGRQNKFYDDTTRDIIDETLKNIENYNQRLYVNEGGIGEEIAERLSALNTANKVEEQVFDLQPDFEPDEYDNEGFEMDDNEFNPLQEE